MSNSRANSSPRLPAPAQSCWRWAPILAVLSWAGCAQTQRPVGIPLGSWEGAGTFVYEKWPSSPEAEPDPSQPTSLFKSYPTTLAVRRVSVLGEQVVELEIHSRRGSLPDLGDETHIIVGLCEVKAAAESAKLYRLGYSAFNPTGNYVRGLSDSAPPIGASCFAMNGDIVLHVCYEEGFADTFRFRGDLLLKDGAYYDPGEGFISWTEVLHRVE